MPFENTLAKAWRPIEPLLRARDTNVKAKFWAIKRNAHNSHSLKSIIVELYHKKPCLSSKKVAGRLDTTRYQAHGAISSELAHYA